MWLYPEHPVQHVQILHPKHCLQHNWFYKLIFFYLINILWILIFTDWYTQSWIKLYHNRPFKLLSLPGSPTTETTCLKVYICISQNIYAAEISTSSLTWQEDWTSCIHATSAPSAGYILSTQHPSNVQQLILPSNMSNIHYLALKTFTEASPLLVRVSCQQSPQHI